MFNFKTEAYSYTLMVLEYIKSSNVSLARDSVESEVKEVSKNDLIIQLINKLKIDLENHELRPVLLVDELEKIKSYQLLTPQEVNLINKLQYMLQHSSYEQTIEERFRNPFGRRIESEFAIVFLTNPTLAMMEAVGRISQAIIPLIEKLEEDNEFEHYLDEFCEFANDIAFGAFQERPTVQAIIKTLKENNPTNLAKTMLIHFKFGQEILRYIPFRGPDREPVGEVANIIRSCWDKDLKKFFSEGLAQKTRQGRALRLYISNNAIYESKLYKAFPNRGREGGLRKNRTQKLGLMLSDQEVYEVNFPTHFSSWVADCKNQNADYSSPYVRDLIDNNAIYVAGYSGMASVFLGQMEMLGNFENEVLKKNYLMAIVAYIVAGGFHSIHEVIGPAQYILKLVPGYQVDLPKNNQLALPPNYHQFFAEQMEIDPEFVTRYNQAWQNYLDFFNNFYKPNFELKDSGDDYHASVDTTALINPTCDISNLEITKALQQVIMQEVDNYIDKASNTKGSENLSFVKHLLHSERVKKAKLAVANDVKTKLEATSNLTELKLLVEHAKLEVKCIIKNSDKLYTKINNSRLLHVLDNIVCILNDFEDTVILDKEFSSQQFKS